MQPSELPGRAALSRAAWEHFVTTGDVDVRMDPVIARSWQRCAPLLDPNGPAQWNDPGTGLLPLLSVQHSFLRLVARPVMEDIFQFIEGSGHVLVLTDASGCVFEMLGDPDAEAEMGQLGFRPGAFLDEHRIGTNAFAVALAEGFPVQVAGPEHFLVPFHGLHSAAAPLHDPAGNDLGAIGLLRPFMLPQSPILGIAYAAAKAIENQLQAEHVIREAHAQATEFNATLDAISEGILAWNTQGVVTHLNGRGGELLGLLPAQVVGRPLIDRITLPESLSRAAARGESLSDVEASFRVDGEKHDVSVNLRIIRQAKGEPLAYLTTLRPMAQVHQLVNRLLGAQARLTLDDIVGQGSAAQSMRRQAMDVVQGQNAILLVGEQGTGKNSLARAIHNSGIRAGGPFLAINAHAVPREMVLDEFLGFEPGTFSGSTGQPSKFELADGGTLFIEEIDALPLEMQAVLSRIIRTREVVRMGGKRAIPVDVRIIASTESDLEARARSGSFQMALHECLSGSRILVPPLRERSEDIPLLIDRILERLRLPFGRAFQVSRKALELLVAHPWLGNIAELESVLEQAASSVEDGNILAEHLAGLLARPRETSADAVRVETLQDLEKQAIAEAIRVAKGNLSKAARMLDISRNTLYRKIRELDIRTS